MEIAKSQVRQRIDLVEKIEWLALVEAGKDLSSTAKVVASRLVLGHLNNHTLRCDPSMPTLAKGIGRTVSVVADALAELRDAGWIEWTPKKGERNRYRLLRGLFDAVNAGTHPEHRNPTPPEDRKGVHRNTGGVPHRNSGSEPVTERSEEPVSSTGGGPGGPVREGKERIEAFGRKGPMPATDSPLPADFELTPDRRAVAETAGVAGDDIVPAFAAFRAHYQGNGQTWRSWDAAWRFWCERRRNQPAPRVSSPSDSNWQQPVKPSRFAIPVNRDPDRLAKIGRMPHQAA